MVVTVCSSERRVCGTNYVVTAQKPTAVYAAALGHFTSPTDLNFIVAKSNILEISAVTPDGLKPLKEVTIYGRIDYMEFIHKGPNEKDQLFVLTRKFDAMILECVKDGLSMEIVTHAYGNVRDRIGRPSESGSIGIIDPQNSVIGLRLFEGLFKVIPIDNEMKELKAFNVRMEELQVIDVKFLYGCSAPTIVLIHQDNVGRHVKTHEISMRDKEFLPGPWQLDHVDKEATFLIPVPEPFCGVVVIGQESISYLNPPANSLTIAPPVMNEYAIICYGKIDDHRYLLGDSGGRLFALLLQKDEKTPGVIGALKLELIGHTSIAETLTYLDNSVVFVGSRNGDSQLIRLTTEQNADGSYMQLLDSYVNLGPIVDMCVVDLENQGQGQLITCSGAYKDGSLRIIRNGIGIQELATVDLQGIKGVWALQSNPGSCSFHNLLAVNFVQQTRLLKFASGDEIEETEMAGFETAEQSHCCANVAFEQILQVTTSTARLISCPSGNLVAHWKDPDNRNISVATCNMYQLLLAIGRQLILFDIGNHQLNIVNQVKLDHEIACLDISPLDFTSSAKAETDQSATSKNSAQLCAVGLWEEISARLYELPSLTLLYSQPLNGEIIPRSLLLTVFENIGYLIVAMGDGNVFHFVIDRQNGELTQQKSVVFGTQPTKLCRLTTKNSHSVFACSDRPTVIYSSNRKLVYSNVNLKEVVCMCSLNAEAYPDSLALANQDCLLIGTIDDIQKLHIRTVPLGESPRRIAYQEETQSLAVLTVRQDVRRPDGAELVPARSSASTMALHTTYSAHMSKLFGDQAAAPAASLDQAADVDTHCMLIFDQYTFEVQHCHQFLPMEFAASIESMQLGEPPQTYYVVGTAFCQPMEPEPKQGRLILFSWNGQQLTQHCEKEIKGAPYSLLEYPGNRLVASINSQVCMFELDSATGELRSEAKYYANILALYLKRKGDFILVGDLMKSMKLLGYKPMENSFDEIARDFQPAWMSAVEVVDADNFLGAENSFNLFSLARNNDATTDEERQHLELSGCYHLGEFVNVFRKGCLVMPHSASELLVPPDGYVIYGTISGSIGIVTQIDPGQYQVLRRLERRLQKVIKGVGRIEHAAWREYLNDRKREDCFGFIDGDLIELFSDLSRDEMIDCCKQLEGPPNFASAGPSSSAAAMDTGAAELSAASTNPYSVDNIIKLVEELTHIR